MITFLELGKKGNLGNQLFQIASTIGIAQVNNHQFCFPKWEMEKYFNTQFPELIHQDWEYIKEEKFNFFNWKIPNGNYSINGWLQTEKYFLDSNIKKIFQFKPDFEKELIDRYEYLFSKKTILVSVRRGDFVNNPNYFQLSYKYYFTALLLHFENLDNYNVIFTSDSIIYCKKHFSFIKNVFFIENLKPIEQICLCSKFDNFVISNSTFSWWIAWLGEKENSKIIVPIKNFSGQYEKLYNEQDFYPNRWIKHDENIIKLSNKYLKLKVYGFIFILKEKIEYEFRVNKKKMKNIIKKCINYK